MQSYFHIGPHDFPHRNEIHGLLSGEDQDKTHHRHVFRIRYER